MKKFIIKSILLTIIVFVFALLYDFYVSYSLIHDQHRIYVGWSDIYTDTTNYDLVINGNSRAWVQYSPMILDTILKINSYNLGIDGSCIDRQMIKYRKYCEHHGQPKYLLQNLEYFTMGRTNGYEKWQFYPYFIVDRKMIHELRETEHLHGLIYTYHIIDILALINLKILVLAYTKAIKRRIENGMGQ